MSGQSAGDRTAPDDRSATNPSTRADSSSQGTDALEETVVPGEAGRANPDQDATIIQDETPDAAAQGAAKSKSGSRKRITQLGDFRLKRKLGEGGMGEVYEARQVSLDRRVAVKVLSRKLASQKVAVDRFQREARAMAKLDHPNVVRVYSVGEEHGLHYAAIE
ncbi:MAG: hypothetical protein D6741_19520, partial [Planctomycetota bacterium]